MNVIETARLVVRPLTMDDLEAVHQLLDLDLEWAGPGISIEQRREKLRFQIDLAQWADAGRVYGNRGIVLKETRQLIGICGFRPWICTPAQRTAYDPSPAAGEHPFNALELGVGYALARAHRGRGYATEAVKALVEYGFRDLGVRRIVALTGRGNLASVHLMERVGMKIGTNPDPDVMYPWVIGIVENDRR